MLLHRFTPLFINQASDQDPSKLLAQEKAFSKETAVLVMNSA